MMTAAVLDFRPRYRGEELDRLAKEVAEVLAPVFEARGWRWDGEIPSAIELGITTRRLLQVAAEDEKDGLTILDRVVVERTVRGELRVYLHLDAVMPVDDEGR